MSSVDYVLLGRRPRSKYFYCITIFLVLLAILTLTYVFDPFHRKNVYRFDIPESLRRKTPRKQVDNFRMKKTYRNGKSAMNPMNSPKKRFSHENHKFHVQGKRPVPNDSGREFKTKKTALTPVFGGSAKELESKSEFDLKSSVDALQIDDASQIEAPKARSKKIQHSLPKETIKKHESILKTADRDKIDTSNDLQRLKPKSRINPDKPPKHYLTNYDKVKAKALITPSQIKLRSPDKDRHKKMSLRKGTLDEDESQVININSIHDSSKSTALQKGIRAFDDTNDQRLTSTDQRLKTRKAMDDLLSQKRRKLPKSKSLFGVDKLIYYDDKSSTSSSSEGNQKLETVKNSFKKTSKLDKSNSTKVSSSVRRSKQQKMKVTKVASDTLFPEDSDNLKRRSFIRVNKIDNYKKQRLPMVNHIRYKSNRTYRNKLRTPNDTGKVKATKVLPSKTPDSPNRKLIPNEGKDLQVDWLIRDPKETSIRDVENILFKSKSSNSNAVSLKKAKPLPTDDGKRDGPPPNAARKGKLAKSENFYLKSLEINDLKKASGRSDATENVKSNSTASEKAEPDEGNEAFHNIKAKSKRYNGLEDKRQEGLKSSGSDEEANVKKEQRQNEYLTEEAQASMSASGIRILRKSSLLSGAQPTSNWDYSRIEKRFVTEIQNPHVSCAKKMVGDKKDGWFVCLQGWYAIKKPCLVYSCGGSSYSSFERELSQKYHCLTRLVNASFVTNPLHPITGLQFHFYRLSNFNGYDPEKKVKMITLKKFMMRNEESDKVIDLLKIDYGHSIWSILDNVLTQGSLSHVKQLILAIDFHGENGGPTSTADYLRYLSALRGLERAGFKMYHSVVSRHHYVEGQILIRSYELFYVNMNMNS